MGSRGIKFRYAITPIGTSDITSDIVIIIAENGALKGKSIDYTMNVYYKLNNHLLSGSVKLTSRGVNCVEYEFNISGQIFNHEKFQISATDINISQVIKFDCIAIDGGKNHD